MKNSFKNALCKSVHVKGSLWVNFQSNEDARKHPPVRILKQSECCLGPGLISSGSSDENARINEGPDH